MTPKALRKIHAIQKHLNNDIDKLKNDQVVSLPPSRLTMDYEKKLKYQQDNRNKLIQNKVSELKWVDKILKNNT